MTDDDFARRFFTEAANEYLESLLYEDEAGKCVTISDPLQADNPIIYASKGFIELTGYAREEIIGRNCRFLQSGETNPAAVEAIRMALAARVRFTIDLLNHRKDGSRFTNRLRVRPIFDQHGQLIYFVGAQTPLG